MAVFCTVLPYISGMHGTSGAYDGACCRPGQQKSAVMSYKALEKEGSKWHIHGWIAMLGCYMLMMYYTTVSGWMVAYFFKFLKGDFTSGMNTDDTAAAFGNMLADPKQMAFWMIVTVVLGFWCAAVVCRMGLRKSVNL